VLQVKKILVPQRENPIVNRLNKTKVEKFPDLAQEKEEKLKALRKKDQAARLERVSRSLHPNSSVLNPLQKKEEARIAQERKEKKWQKDHAYDELFQEEDPDDANNQDRGEDFLDDFM
jgi:hypothetical protein